jgi:hypothetical protein
MLAKTIAKLSIACLAAALSTGAWADMGPKPTLSIRFSPPVASVSIASGQLLQCKDLACANPTPLKPLGPQRFGCGAMSCFGRAYGFAPYAKLALTLSDGRTLTSAVFKTKGFNGAYHARIVVGKLLVETGP